MATLLLAIAFGLVCVSQLPEQMGVRIVLAILYVPATFGGLALLYVLAEWLLSGNSQQSDR